MKKRTSILFRFTMLFFLVMAAVFLGSFVFIRFFLDKYYLHEKFVAMRLAYTQFIELAEKPLSDAELSGQDESLIILNGVPYKNKNDNPLGKPGDVLTESEIELEDRESIEKYTHMSYELVQRYSRALAKVERKQGISVIIQIAKDKCLSSYEVNSGWMLDRLTNLRMRYRLSEKSGYYNDDSIVEVGENFCLQYNVDASTNTKYIDMWGYLTNGTWFLMSTPVEEIRDSAMISARFYLYTGGIAIVLGVILGFIVMRRATRPIVELTDLSKKMADLDLDATYQGETDSEIGILGNNLNQLSARLQATMGELQNANLELKKDIEKKELVERQRIDFISNVSHELKTPIALIQGYAEGLSEGITDDPESMKFYCEVIVDEAQKMNRLVTQLLSLNQLEAGNNKIEITRFNLTELLRGAVSAQDILMKQNDCYITMKQTEPLFVWGDEYKIEEVVMNYLSNAWNHLAGKKQISIDVESKDDYVRVSVYNTGKNIPKEDLDRIWEKFYKVDKAHTRQYGGHGIGLSIVKAIMERHDGSCGAYNREDGVVFWFEIRRA